MKNQINKPYINTELIGRFQSLNDGYNYKKLIAILNEINSSYSSGNSYACATLLRALFDHIPPLFGFNNFESVVNQHPWQQSVKEFMKRLLDFKNEPDDILHSHINNKEDFFTIDNLPSNNRVNRLLQEAVVSKRLDPTQATLPQKTSSPTPIVIKFEPEHGVTWANHGVGRRTWSCFRLVISINNFKSNKPDYIYVELTAKDNDGVWKASNFEFESSSEHGEMSINKPFRIEANSKTTISVFISNSTDNQRIPLPDLDRDTLKVLVKTESGTEFEFIVPPACIRTE